ncbi:hypothetical protein AB1Y20_023025 [Prymnesium parvum]|uniref:Uncharacterized protein n=1 Tax=Prymnesium parvum TaxID=97485 RepID=A0AB34JCM4_PRYPA
MDDGAITSTAKRAAKTLEDSITGNASTDVFDSRVRAVAALQAIFRKSVGSPASRRLDDKEPCAWLALAGKCKEKACKSCASGLEFDAATIQAIKARCAAGLFDGAKQPVKDPG